MQSESKPTVMKLRHGEGQRIVGQIHLKIQTTTTTSAAPDEDIAKREMYDEFYGGHTIIIYQQLCCIWD